LHPSFLLAAEQPIQEAVQEAYGELEHEPRDSEQYRRNDDQEQYPVRTEANAWPQLLPTVPAESILHYDTLPKRLPHEHPTRPSRRIATASGSRLRVYQLALVLPPPTREALPHTTTGPTVRGCAAPPRSGNLCRVVGVFFIEHPCTAKPLTIDPAAPLCRRVRATW
jgi:hypothetical protein